MFNFNMVKDRTFIVLLLALLLFLAAAEVRPRPLAVTVLPLSYNPVQEINPASRRFWVLKAQAPTRFDMLLMGDSRIYRGLSPAAMQSVLAGARILNYGFSGGGLNPEMYAAAQARLDPLSSRKAIVLGVSPLTLTPRAEANEHFLQEMGRPPETLFLYQSSQPLVTLFEPIQPSETNPPSPGGEGYYLEFHDDGWVASWTIPERTDSALSSYYDIFRGTRVEERLVQALLDQTRKWTRAGIRVYAFRPPASAAMVALEDRMSGFDEASFARRFEEAGGTWFSIPLALYHSYDGSHLIKQSAVQLSLDLAHKIQQSTR
jgi:hypothetical protein